MKYDEFLRKFKINKESWRIINQTAAEKGMKINERYYNIVGQMQKMTQPASIVVSKEMSRNNQMDNHNVNQEYCTDHMEQDNFNSLNSN